MVIKLVYLHLYCILTRKYMGLQLKFIVALLSLLLIAIFFRVSNFQVSLSAIYVIINYWSQNIVFHIPSTIFFSLFSAPIHCSTFFGRNFSDWILFSIRQPLTYISASVTMSVNHFDYYLKEKYIQRT